MIVAKLNVTKFDKSKFFKGEKGVYADIVLIDSPDAFGNDGFIAQSATKEERETGVKGVVVGSFRGIDKKATVPVASTHRAAR
jgi:hypothetical protein